MLFANFCSNTKSLQLFFEKWSLNLANFTEKVFFALIHEIFTQTQKHFTQVPLVTNSKSGHPSNGTFEKWLKWDVWVYHGNNENNCTINFFQRKSCNLNPATPSHKHFVQSDRPIMALRRKCCHRVISWEVQARGKSFEECWCWLRHFHGSCISRILHDGSLYHLDHGSLYIIRTLLTILFSFKFLP